MPMGLVDDAAFEKELQKYGTTKKESHGHVTPQITVVDSPGRKEGDVNVPDSLRKIIGEEGVINGRAAALSIAKDFGVSSSSVSAYMNGATSTASYHEPKQSIISHINQSRARAIKKAGKVLGQSLGSITQDKLDMTDAKDLAGIARDMSVLIKNLEPDKLNDQSNNQPSVQFTIYAPQFRSETSYEVVDHRDE